MSFLSLIVPLMRTGEERGGRKRRAAAFTALALLSTTLASAGTKPDINKLTVHPLKVEAEPIRTFGRAGNEVSTGKLVWRSGLVLSSRNDNFGGWSGLVVEPDGRRFLSVSDSGVWMTGEIAYRGDAMAGIRDARIGPLLTREGRTLRRMRDRDAEAVAVESGDLSKGTMLIAFEGNARIARYDFNAAGVSPTRGFLTLPPQARKLHNSGLEAMTVMKGGHFKDAVIAFAEHLKDSAHDHVGWMWLDGRVEPIQLTDIGDFDIVDLASTEDGTLYVLERRFRWTEGVRIRVRRVAADEVASKRVIAGETLLEADMTAEIDNLEGLAISRDANGMAVLTLISDDNFNHFLQRTLLLQFAVPDDIAEPKTAKARP